MDNKKTNKSFDNWADTYKKGIENIWPNETLIRIVKGKYIPDMTGDFKNKKVIDVGCGTGTNLLLFGNLGADLCGCEVEEDITEIAKEKLKVCGFESDIRVGQNRSIPFESNIFDFLVSWNVIHYEDSKNKIEEAIAEYSRVLKKGGRVFISTTGPQHLILTDAESLGDHRYKIGNAGGMRKNEIYFYFDTPEYLKDRFSDHFENISIGRVNDFLFTAYQDYFILTATRK